MRSKAQTQLLFLFSMWVFSVSSFADAPTATAQTVDATVEQAAVIVLAGSDPENDSITAYTVKTPPAKGTLSGTAPNLSYTSDANVSGTDSFTFTVTANGEESDAATVTINLLSKPNEKPTANAGEDRTVDEAKGLEVELDGSLSSDSDGSIASYSWSQEAGPTVQLSSSTTPKPTFTAPRVGRDGETVTFELIVTDDEGAQSDAASVSIQIANAVNDAPTAGVKESVLQAGPGKTVQLEEFGSSDLDGEGTIASFTWSQLASDLVQVALQDADSRVASFTVPVLDSKAVFNIQLVVADSEGANSEPANVAVQVVLDPNQNKPVADAGEDQFVGVGLEVTLDGSASSDVEDGASLSSYEWTQVSGPSVTLINANSPVATFMAPDQVEGEQQELVFEIRVVDSYPLFDVDEVSIFVGDNERPTVNAGEDLDAEEGQTVYLNATGSDSDGAIETYHWTEVSGLGVTLDDNASAKPHFVAPAFDTADSLTVEFEVTAIDNLKTPSDPDRVQVIIRDNGITTIPNEFFSIHSELEANLPVGFKATEGSLVLLSQVREDDIGSDGKPRGLLGLFDFEIKTDLPGVDGVLVVKFTEPLNENYRWYKYDSAAEQWQLFDTDRVTFNEQRDEITIRLTDGGIGDDDGVKNGLIIDPSGPGLLGEDTRSTGETGGGSLGWFVALLTPLMSRRLTLRPRSV